jgi:hypothetical protein
VIKRSGGQASPSLNGSSKRRAKRKPDAKPVRRKAKTKAGR